MNEEILKLGKLLVNELGVESSVDTLSRWMAHYIAEQMNIIDSAEGDEKKQAEKRCFETILKLWKHMSYYNGSRPFENFKPIFDTLDRINPCKDNPYYFQYEYLQRNKDFNSEDDPVAQYLYLATLVDENARAWLELLFQLDAKAAIDDKVKKWIEAALPLADNDEPSLIVRILSNDENDFGRKENEIKSIEKRIEQLKKFSIFKDELISMYEDEINELK